MWLGDKWSLGAVRVGHGITAWGFFPEPQLKAGSPPGTLSSGRSDLLIRHYSFPRSHRVFPRGHLALPCPHSLHHGRIPPQLQGPLLVGRVGSEQSCFWPHRWAGTAPTWPGAACCSSFSPLLCLQGPGPVGLSLSPSPFSLAEPSALGSQVQGLGSQLGHSEQLLDAFTFCEDE